MTQGTPPTKRPAMFAAALLEHLMLVANFDGKGADEDVSHAAMQAFFAWPKLARAMVGLEELFSDEADLGRALDQKLFDGIERAKDQAA